jgi:murein L,D-transpeptidase YcbB/YkuD
MRPALPFVLVLVCFVAATQGCASGPPAEEVARSIAARSGSAAAGGEPLLEPKAVYQFYKGRSSMPAWLDHVDDIVEAIRATEADGLDPADYHLAAIESLLEKRRDAKRTAGDDAVLDVLLADAVAGIADDVRYGRVRPSQVNPGWTADPRDDAPPLDSTLAVIAKSRSVAAAIDAQRPKHFIYEGLRGALDRLRRIEARGGWPVVSSGKVLRPGAVDPRVAAVRRRLLAGGDLEGEAPGDSTRYDAALTRAVAAFQARHRIDSTGVIDRATVEAMNVSAKARLDQVRANLERARWVLGGGLDQDFMLVNLPAFKAYLIRGQKNVWESRTQIGEEAMQTPTFRAKIRTVVFNPDWTVPPTILAEEILADMRAGKNAIDEQGLVIYDASNNVVDPGSIDWSAATPEEFPYTLRQPAGEDNALGKVKFLFPNKYSIYLHDTPSRHLFDADKRTFSHGCIRIERPLELAQLLLSGQDGWDAGKIEQTVASGTTTGVALERPLPILIVYWTVSVGASGEVRYAEDAYRLDPPLLAALDRASSRA